MNNLNAKFRLVAVMLCYSIVSLAQQDSLKANLLPPIKAPDTLASKHAPYIEIYKLNSKRRFKLVTGQPVRIYISRNRIGGVRSKAAVLSNIGSHEVSFEPSGKQFDFVTYTDSTMTYVEIQTAGSVLRGIVINALLVSAVVVTIGVVIVVALVAAFYGGIPRGSGGGFGNLISLLPWDNFYKHIHFRNQRGIRKWGVRIVGV